MPYTSVCLIAMLTDAWRLSSELERCVTITFALLKQELSVDDEIKTEIEDCSDNKC